MLSKLLPISAGIAAGVITSLFLSRGEVPEDLKSAADPRRAAEIPLSAGAPAPREPRPSAALPARQEARLRELEDRLDVVEAESAKSGAPKEEGQAPPEATIEERRALLESAHERAIEAHSREPVDPAWSTSAASLLDRDLGSLSSEAGLSVVSVDCRSRSCVAALEWPSYDEAVRGYTAVLRTPYEVNCARRLLLPEPPDRALPYRATAIFDCEGQRAQ